jgi:tetratricopeptide (TPR) repeat protein
MKYKYGSIVIIFLNLFLPVLSGHTLESEKPSYFLSLRFLPDISIPLGKQNKEIFRSGFGTDISIRCQMPFWPVLFLDGTFGYTAALTKVDTSVSELDFGAGFGLNFTIASRVLLGGVVQGGYNYSFVHDGSGKGSGHPFLFLGLDFGIKVAPSFSFDTQVGYKQYFGLTSSLTFSFGLGFHINLRKEKAFDFYELDTEKILPIQLNYHNNNPIGTLVVQNTGEKEIEELEITLNTRDYMDKPFVWKLQESIEGGATAEIDLYGLFNQETLTITEEKRVKMEISLKYKYKRQWTNQKFEGELLLYGKNSFFWDDIQKLALFVTPQDSNIQSFAQIALAITDVNEHEVISPNILKAVLIYSALSSSGFEYETDSGYTQFYTNQEKPDYINLPCETLAGRQGNREELGLLFCSLLEASGVETAIIPLPDKLLFAFCLDEEATEEVVSHTEMLIYYEGKAWVPLNITDFNHSFLTAWLSGIEEYYSADIQDVIFTISEAQAVYMPAEMESPDMETRFPDAYDVLTAYNDNLAEYIDWELKPRVDKLLAGSTDDEDNLSILNQIGILYARYGLYDESLTYFERILLKEDYVPALMNMGQVYFLMGELKKALPFYEEAYRKAPLEPIIILCLANLNYALENYASAREAYQKLKSLDPELASQYFYLEFEGDEARLTAREDIEMDMVIWEE